VKTARKAFLRLKSFFENERKYPELAALAVEIRKTNGQEAIVLENGGSVEFVARSKSSGRGFTVDVLVCDEAQELSDESLEALKPTISAAPTQNPQTIFTGTPPGPTTNGEVFTRTRTSSIGGATRHAWHEWSLAGQFDLDDRANWYATNPALGGRLNIEVLEDERATFSDEGFARERLGVWADASGEAVIPARAWAALADLSPTPEPHIGKLVLAVDSDPPRSRLLAAGRMGFRWSS
jgi:phage terminase large subunit-like protein